MTDIQGTAAGAVDKFGNQIGEAVEKAGEFIDEKTGGKYSDQIQAGVGKVEDALDGLDGQNDDIGAEPQARAEPSGEAPAEPQSESPAPDPTGQAEAPAEQPEAPAQPEGAAPPAEPSTPEAGTTPQR